ncbi:hypothetical protein K439DRAFT_1646631 [Ramaria rubella]|nr:hypothetical protein K439DRAFT_1646631 [Ramaria rubella]
MLLWIQNSLSPLEIRACDTVEYLERSHQGEFLNGIMEDVWERIDSAKDMKGQMIYGGKNSIVWRSNRHSCGEKTCKKNKWRTCKACFTRELHQHSEVDSKTGHINLKKGEAWINTFTPIVTYLLRCNSDVTSLLSGTAIKAVITHVTDYVSKSPLKTYGIFESIKDIFDRNAEMLNSEKPRQELGTPITL